MFARSPQLHYNAQQSRLIVVTLCVMNIELKRFFKSTDHNYPFGVYQKQQKQETTVKTFFSLNLTGIGISNKRKANVFIFSLFVRKISLFNI